MIANRRFNDLRTRLRRFFRNMSRRSLLPKAVRVWRIRRTVEAKPQTADLPAKLLKVLNSEKDVDIQAIAAAELVAISGAQHFVVRALAERSINHQNPSAPIAAFSRPLVSFGVVAAPQLTQLVIDEISDNNLLSFTAQVLLQHIGQDALDTLLNAIETSEGFAQARLLHATAEILRGGGALRDLERVRVRNAAVGLLWSADEEVGHSAARLLGALKDASTVPQLIDRLAQGNYASVGAALALGDIGDVGAVEPLVELVMDAQRFRVPRAAAATALGGFGDRAASVLPRLREVEKRSDIHNTETWSSDVGCAVRSAISLIERGAAE
jgi:HEAT repeat protein